MYIPDPSIVIDGCDCEFCQATRKRMNEEEAEKNSKQAAASPAAAPINAQTKSPFQFFTESDTDEIRKRIGEIVESLMKNRRPSDYNGPIFS